MQRVVDLHRDRNPNPGAAQIVADADVLDTAGIVAFVAFIVWVFVVSVFVTRAVMRSEAVTS